MSISSVSPSLKYSCVVVAQVRERQYDEPHADAVSRLERRRSHHVQIANRLPVAFDVCNESIAPPMQCLDEPWIVGVVAKGGAQALDRRVQAVLEVDECPRWPQAQPKLFARDHIAGSLEHHHENLEWLILQPDADAPLPQLARTHIDLEGPESFDVRRTASYGQHRRKEFICPYVCSRHFTKCERRVSPIGSAE